MTISNRNYHYPNNLMLICIVRRWKRRQRANISTLNNKHNNRNYPVYNYYYNNNNYLVTGNNNTITSCYSTNTAVRSSSTIRSSSSTSSTSQRRRIIDFRSDTVTSPSSGMLQTVLTATTGDDVMGEDRTVNELQDHVADMFGMEKGLFVPTGTMSNICAIIAHCTNTGSCSASEIIIGSQSHISLWEGGNTSSIGNVFARQLPEQTMTAEMDLITVQNMIRTDIDDHYAETKLICLENTHNELGGIPLSLQYINQVGTITKQHDIKLHVDGARIWNASIATGISLKEYCTNVNSVSVCLSKGLGCPIGSVLVGDTDFIRLAKRTRKRLGGGMRQVGIVAAMGLYAIQNNIQRLHIDHDNAKLLANTLAANGFTIHRNPTVRTNIFYFSLPTQLLTTTTTMIQPQQFQQQLLNEYGIKLSSGYGPSHDIFRIVTHLDINKEDIDTAATAMINICHRNQTT